MNKKLQEDFQRIEAAAKNCIGKVTYEKLLETVIRQCLDAACRNDAASVASENAAAPAFPSSPSFQTANGDPWRPADIGCAGMTKREAFAKAAMQGLLSAPGVYVGAIDAEHRTTAKASEMVAREAVDYADALLERLSHV